MRSPLGCAITLARGQYTRQLRIQFTTALSVDAMEKIDDGWEEIRRGICDLAVATVDDDVMKPVVPSEAVYFGPGMKSRPKQSANTKAAFREFVSVGATGHVKRTDGNSERKATRDQNYTQHHAAVNKVVNGRTVCQPR